MPDASAASVRGRYWMRPSPAAAATAWRHAVLPVLLVTGLAAAASPQTAPGKPPATPAAKSGASSQRAVAAAGNAAYTGDLDGMITRRVIRVGTAYNRTHYFIDKGVQRGI